jgi:hypothetical protein
MAVRWLNESIMCYPFFDAINGLPILSRVKVNTALRTIRLFKPLAVDHPASSFAVAAK